MWQNLGLYGGMRSYHVYVLVNRMNRRFIALGENPKEELVQHNKGEFKWTTQFKPWKLEWISGSMPRRDAERLERKLLPHKTNPNALMNLLDEHSIDQDEDVFGGAV